MSGEHTKNEKVLSGGKPEPLGSMPEYTMSAVTEPPKSLGPSTVVLVQRTLDNPVDAPDHLTSSVPEFLTFPKSVSPVTQILQHIGGTDSGSNYSNLIYIKI
jgi:hypothetical protein